MTFLTQSSFPRLWLLGMIILMTAAQVMFKLAGNHAGVQLTLVSALISNPWLWAGLLLSAAGMVCWLLTLRKVSLSKAYPWTALIYVLTPLASAWLFGDALDSKYLLGLASIVAGVFLTAGGVSPE
jgi:drug/metabolite transporter (DMT)-like permease